MKFGENGPKKSKNPIAIYPKTYFSKKANIATLQLHNFSDASEIAYAGAVYS